jgi:UDP:flavonoid glycosyltransferase YjiC (YdhE family)
MTGFWHWPVTQGQGPGGRPTETLEAFLAAPGEAAPVVFSFGSMGGQVAEMSALVAVAVKRVGCRAILQGGWGGLAAQGETDRRILCVDYVPHDFLFPRAACVVHHGGAGVTAAALRAGVPSVSVWHMLDQPYWGHLLARQGLGPKPLARYGLRAEALAQSMIEAMTTPSYRERCAAMACQLADENGVARAVAEIDRVLL